MIPDPEAYFREFIPPRDAFLKSLEKEAEKEGIPIVGPVVGELLYIIARAMGARMILELGTATGYSAIYLARACALTRGHLVTLEWDQEMAQRARKNFEKIGADEIVEVVTGDALKKISSMNGPFDLVFLALDKEYYADALPHCHRLLRVGGLLFADNVGFKGADPFNREIFNTKEWRVVNLFSFLPEHSPEKDGLSLALRVQ